MIRKSEVRLIRRRVSRNPIVKGAKSVHRAWQEGGRRHEAQEEERRKRKITELNKRGSVIRAKRKLARLQKPKGRKNKTGSLYDLL